MTQHARSFGVIFVLVALLDLAMRVAVPSLSGSVNHIQELPDLAATLCAEREPRVLVLGNSLMNNAVNPGPVVVRLGLNGATVGGAVEMTPDGTSLWDWFFIYRDEFRNACFPDVAVVGFAWRQLEDHYRPVPSRLGGYFAGPEDLRVLQRMGLTGFDQQAEFLVANVSSLYANREAIRNRGLALLIPAYETFTQEINEEERAGVRSATAGEGEATYTRLEMFLDVARQRGTKVVFVAMPVQTPYDLDPGLPARVREAGMEFIDFRSVPGIRVPDHYVDSIHLSEEGRDIFTAALARELVRLDVFPATPTTATNP